VRLSEISTLILPGVNAGAAWTYRRWRRFAGLRYNLFSRANRPEDARGRTGVPMAVPHSRCSILSVRTRSYLRGGMFSAPLQSALATAGDEHTYNPRSTRFDVVSSPHRRTRLRGVPFVLFQYFDSTFFALVFEVLVDAIERPRVEFLVAGLPQSGLERLQASSLPAFQHHVRHTL